MKLDKVMFNEILQTQSHSRSTRRMEKTITRIAQRSGATVVEDSGNVYVTKGQASLYPCVVAHTDTVHRIVPHEQFVVRKAHLTERECGFPQNKSIYYGWNPVLRQFTGIGGDDKVGIFVALMMLQTFDTIKVAFFRDEEIGCIGSGQANMDFFDDVSLVLQCDRQGNDDFVNRISGSQLYGHEFGKAVRPILEKYGYKESGGMMTDVQALKQGGLGVAAANMSCGYWRPHSDDEYIVIQDVQNCTDMVHEIIVDLGGQKWEHKDSVVRYYGNWSGSEWDYDYHGWHRGGATPRTSKKVKVVPRQYRWHECANCEMSQVLRYDETEQKWYCTGCLEYTNMDDETEDTFAFLDRVDRDFWDD